MRHVTEFISPEALDGPGRDRAAFPEITDPVFWDAYGRAAPFSMVHIPGFLNVYQSLAYIARNDVPGAFVECGCFLGGVGIFIAILRRHFGLSSRRLLLLDTFEGFPEGRERETTRDGTVVKGAKLPNMRADVEANLRSEVSDLGGIELIEGPVEMTVPNLALEAVSLLRLDTDFYSSTRAELDHLYPKLVRGGVLIVDDYGFFNGSRRATDEFIARTPSPPLLNRIDGAVWAGVKP